MRVNFLFGWRLLDWSRCSSACLLPFPSKAGGIQIPHRGTPDAIGRSRGIPLRRGERLPEGNLPPCSQIQRCRGKTQCTEDAAHGGQRYAMSVFQLGDLRFPNPDLLAQLLLRETLLCPGFPNGFPQFMDTNCFRNAMLKLITTCRTHLSKLSVQDLLKVYEFHFTFLLHLYFLLSLKYSFLIDSAFAISLAGVFWVFLIIP